MGINVMKQSGFTLIELMITVVIVSILAAIAIPSYRDHVRQSNRADAKAVLLENAQFMERNLTEANRYDQTSAGATTALLYTQSPKTGTANYAMGFVSGSLAATTYTLQAVPSGSMTGDACGTLTLTHTGVKGVSGASLTATDCWNR